ncbi:MAG: DUF3037 domain-containing protein [Chitinophagia bacterium]|nr:DUF3037 domain-containing protein [Chitinophagia bacterium]
MNGRLLFEYAIIRLVPRVEREEFINIGIVLYCASRKYLCVQYHLPATRIEALYSGFDIAEADSYLQSFAQVCQGGRKAGPIGQLTVAERFRWLTAIRSTVIQTSRVHPGFCIEPAAQLEALFAAYVL